MRPSITVRRRVEFADTDMAGIVHFSAFFRFMEAAEHEFLRQRGLNVAMEEDGSHISWPRVSASCEYRRPARFGDVLEIDVVLDQLSRRSATYRFNVRCADHLLAEGKMTSVCCRLTPGEPPEAIEIPPAMREKLEGEGDPS